MPLRLQKQLTVSLILWMCKYIASLTDWLTGYTTVCLYILPGLSVCLLDCWINWHVEWLHE